MTKGTTLDALEEALDGQDWGPEYRDPGEPMDYASYEISIEERTLYVEITGISLGNVITSARICEYDENGIDFLEVWDVEDIDETEGIIEQIKDFIREI